MTTIRSLCDIRRSRSSSPCQTVQPAHVSHLIAANFVAVSSPLSIREKKRVEFFKMRPSCIKKLAAGGKGISKARSRGKYFVEST